MTKLQFVDRAMAIQGILEADDRICDIDLIGAGEDDDQFDPRAAMRLKPDSEECMLLTERHVIVGGLMYDSDCESPLESCDGEGKIFHAPGRRGDSSEHREYLRARGLDENGEPDIDCDAALQVAKGILKEFFDSEISILVTLRAELGGSGAKMSIADVEAEIERIVEQAGAAEACNRMAAHLEGEGRAKLEDLARGIDAMVIERITQGRGLMDPMTVLLDIYEHSGISYSVHSSGGGCQWDTSRGGAVWVPDACARENIECSVKATKHLQPEDGEAYIEAIREAAEVYCKGVMEQYTDWCNGSCYGVVVYAFDRATGESLGDDDECWGFIGIDWARENLHDTMISMASHVLAKYPSSQQPVAA